jgi:putative membrane protein
MSTGPLREYFGIYLRGFAMGAADSVPGVSGGTIALITGIYDRLVGAITAMDPRILRRVLDPDEATAGEEVVEMLIAMDLRFLAALGLGIASAIVTAASVVHFALHEYPGVTFAFFFGLIAASAVVLFSEMSVDSPARAAVAVAGFVLAVVVTGLPPGALPHTPVVVFASGVVAVSAMVLPGVSGSLLLLVLGQYEYMLSALRGFIASVLGLATGGPLAPVFETALPVVLFVAGAGIGLLSVAHVISWALAHYRAATLTFLVSLMAGALRKPVEEVLAAVGDWTAPTVAVLLLAAGVGAGLVLGFDYYADVDY